MKIHKNRFSSFGFLSHQSSRFNMVQISAGGLVLLIGLFLLACTYLLYQKDSKFFQHATHTQGKVVALGLRENGYRSAVVRFTAQNGREITFTVNDYGFSQYVVGSYKIDQHVPIMYEAAAPENVKVKRFGELWGNVMVVGLLGSIFAITGFLIATDFIWIERLLNSFPFLNLFPGLVIISLGLSVLYLSYWDYSLNRDLINRSVFTKGKVVKVNTAQITFEKIRTTDHAENQNEETVAVYRPTIEFRTKTDQAIQFMANGSTELDLYQLNQEVDVLYDPDKPEDALLKSPYIWSAAQVLGGTGIMILILGAFAFTFGYSKLR